MKIDYEKIMVVIRHHENKVEHIDSIFRLITNFNSKWNCFSDGDPHMQLYLSVMISAFNKLVNNLNKK